MWLTAWAYIESQQQRIVYVFKGWDSGQSNLERKGSGLLILIIPSGRNPLHGPAVADRIFWSVRQPWNVRVVTGYNGYDADEPYYDPKNTVCERYLAPGYDNKCCPPR